MTLMNFLKQFLLVKHISLFFAFSFFLFATTAQNIPAKPEKETLVNDFSQTLTSSEVLRLEETLHTFSQKTSNQILVVIVPDLLGYDKADYAQRLAESWGIGKKEYNNGMIILIKPKINNESGQVYIGVGYGLEGAIPDAIAKRIVEQEMIPLLKQNNYFGAISSATTVLMELASGEYSYEQYDKKTSKKGKKTSFFILLILIIITIIFRGKRRGGRRRGGIDGTDFILLGGLGANSLGRSSSSWGGGFSSGGSGGFGGFGGGGFGGGGAGGSW